MIISCHARVAVLAALAILLPAPATGLSIKEFRKYPQDKQAVYVTGAVSMTAYTYAVNGETTRARCVQNWYFSVRGADTPGPRAIALELGVAELKDAEKYHVEGIILGLADKVCGESPKPK